MSPITPRDMLGTYTDNEANLPYEYELLPHLSLQNAIARLNIEGPSPTVFPVSYEQEVERPVNVVRFNPTTTGALLRGNPADDTHRTKFIFKGKCSEGGKKVLLSHPYDFFLTDIRFANTEAIRAGIRAACDRAGVTKLMVRSTPDWNEGVWPRMEGIQHHEAQMREQLAKLFFLEEWDDEQNTSVLATVFNRNVEVFDHRKTIPIGLGERLRNARR